ncbi:unnamed protein product [Acanthoscelides obtectus]|uniref:Uncharacterized protein n=1 Tax=Acanthoscelides obtectus TaxID=200917 RepID=A0A9P0KXP8_ACAOB|nr:unnamed protein product [Acanthoscelides obtectus]CAK1639262.1 hypothetical protein AOBTE_LOCUS11077 [Acanthoscelides obtectus]
MYYTKPNKPESSSKTYYLDELVECLKKRFQKARTECLHQSIDETMTKFKEGSSLKQYLPMKPIKRESSCAKDAIPKPHMFTT